MHRPTVIVICGGRSPEHEISCRSAQYVAAELRAAGYPLRIIGIATTNTWHLQDSEVFLQQGSVQEGEAIACGFYPQTQNFFTAIDVNYPQTEVIVWPVMHGHNGEDGTLQGMLTLSGVPYVGADVTAAAVSFDKIMTRTLVRDAGIAVVESLVLTATEWETAQAGCLARIKAELHLPLFVKPSRAGSSIGISRVTAQDQLSAAITQALQGDGRVLVERAVDAVEVECAVVGDLVPESAACLAEVNTVSGFYDYHAKYVDYREVDVAIPARLKAPQVEEVRNMAHRIFRLLCINGLVRVDFLRDKQRHCFYFNEVNTLPGFTNLSRFPLMWQRSGVSMPQLLAKILQTALTRQRRVNAWEQHLLQNRGG